MLGARSAGLDCRTLKSQDSRQLSAMQTPFSTQSDEKKKKGTEKILKIAGEV